MKNKTVGGVTEINEALGMNHSLERDDDTKEEHNGAYEFSPAK